MSQNSNGGTPPAVPPAAPPPADQQGDTGDDKDKFRGISKELARARAEAEELRTWKAEQEAAQEAAKIKALEEQGKWKELAAAKAAEADKYKSSYEVLQKAEVARLETLTKTNKARLEVLPENIRVLMPDGLTADAAAAQLAKLESFAGIRPAVSVHGGAPRGSAPPDPGASSRAFREKSRKFIFGDDADKVRARSDKDRAFDAFRRQLEADE